MKQLEKKKVKFSTRMLSATGIGLVLGLLIQFVGGFPDAPLEVPFIAEINKWYGLFAIRIYGFIKNVSCSINFRLNYSCHY